MHAVRHDTSDGVFLLNVEYKVGTLEYVTLADKTSKEDLAQKLVKEGLLLVENKKERRLQKLVRSIVDCLFSIIMLTVYFTDFYS